MAVARAVLETSDCQGRKFLHGRPPRVMHIHEYSNVIERRREGGREGERERRRGGETRRLPGSSSASISRRLDSRMTRASYECITQVRDSRTGLYRGEHRTVVAAENNRTP